MLTNKCESGCCLSRLPWRRYRPQTVAYTPVHGNWLNMPEIEIAIIGRESELPQL